MVPVSVTHIHFYLSWNKTMFSTGYIRKDISHKLTSCVYWFTFILLKNLYM